MRVLHLPTNIASQMRVTVLALRDLGIEARGLTGSARIQNAGGLEILPRGGEQASFIERKAFGICRAAAIMRAIAWADVVHWHSGPGLPMGADLRFASALGRRKFVEFWGSDIRDPEVEKGDNRFLASALESGECEWEFSRADSLDLQRRFSRCGARLFIPSPAMARYVAPESFPQFQWTSQRIFLHEFEPSFPSPASRRPLVVHAPSAPGIKGTNNILAAVEKLRSECDFDFQIVQGMTPQEAKICISRCDIFVDQLMIGEYGLASVEAMAMGKPVVCYMKQSVLGHYPGHFPVINANPENVESVLRELLSDGPRRRKAGEDSRRWVEERHDARTVVRRIAEYYQMT